jgi:uncharacterized protein
VSATALAASTYSDSVAAIRIFLILDRATGHQFRNRPHSAPQMPVSCIIWQRIKSMRVINIATLVLVIVGAVNWGLMGLFQFDLVATLFGGPQTALSRIVYVLVGLAGLYQVVPLLGVVSARAKNPQLATSPRH